MNSFIETARKFASQVFKVMVEMGEDSAESFNNQRRWK